MKRKHRHLQYVMHKLIVIVPIIDHPLVDGYNICLFIMIHDYSK